MTPNHENTKVELNATGLLWLSVVGTILLALWLLAGYGMGKHAADRWYAGHQERPEKMSYK